MSSHKDMGISFYMEEVDSKGIVVEGSSRKDLEKDFDGMLYMKLDGLESQGKLRCHTETYADSDRMRVYIPDVQTYDPTELTFKFLFTGDRRRETYDAFVSYVTKGIHSFWDTVRKKKVIFYTPNEITPNEVGNKGGNQFIELSFKATNIFGRNFDVE